MIKTTATAKDGRSFRARTSFENVRVDGMQRSQYGPALEGQPDEISKT
jgi:hypothetical protein